MDLLRWCAESVFEEAFLALPGSVPGSWFRTKSGSSYFGVASPGAFGGTALLFSFCFRCWQSSLLVDLSSYSLGVRIIPFSFFLSVPESSQLRVEGDGLSFPWA